MHEEVNKLEEESTSYENLRTLRCQFQTVVTNKSEVFTTDIVHSLRHFIIGIKVKRVYNVLAWIIA